jgi:chromosomal replication initiation ATPase DnaA
MNYSCRCHRLTERQLLAAGRTRLPAEARALVAWLALQTKAASLTTLAHAFGRDISTLSHALSRVEERSRKSPAFAKALDRHLYAISQA